jgi:asparagine synthase (glutamine-hydrolysing)
MSGIAGIVTFDGTPANPDLIRRMTDSMAFRGPDHQGVWIDGPAGLGHTLLRTTLESANERQPATLDRVVWITADVRLDARTELIARLQSLGRDALPSTNDAELILHAYHAWGDACAEQLLGDFAFAIWDGRRRSLLCARDHFGVKPFFYARVDAGIVFSNTLDCVRLHPGVGDALNEVAIGDFLLFGSNQEPTTTTFAGIQRLAAAHSLSCEEGALRLTRYWTLPGNGRIRYRRSDEYIDHFRELLRAAVADRLRVRRVGVWMSGGLDSTSITATAHQLLSEGTDPFDLRTHTIVYDALIPDDERDYAQIAADTLGVRSSYFVADGYKPFDGWNQRDLRTPEPNDDPFLLMRRRQLKDAAAHSRVMLCGEGGDEVLWGSHVVELFLKVPWLDLGADIARSLILHRRRPAIGVRAAVKKALGHRPLRSAYPPWVKQAFADRVNLRARWEQVTAPELANVHSGRPEAHRRLATAPWTWYFESVDPGVTRLPVEARYPFLDVRLVHYLLAIPSLPWFIDKHLLRAAMRGALPDRIRLRPKAPLAADPLHAQLRASGVRSWDTCPPTPELENRVDPAAVPNMAGGYDGQDPWLHVRPLCLNYWLKGVPVHAAARGDHR